MSTPAEVRAAADAAIAHADAVQTRDAYLAAEEASRHAERRTARNARGAHYVCESERMVRLAYEVPA